MFTPNEKVIQTLLAGVDIHYDKLITRPDFIAAAIATELSRVLPVPATLPDSTVIYFNIECMPLVNRVISNINEICVLDCAATLRLTMNLWNLRVCAAFPCEFNKTSKGSFLARYLNVGEHISPEQHAFLDANVEALAAVSERARAVIDAVKSF